MNGWMVSGWQRYCSALARPGLGRLMPAFLISALGDGMSLIAIPWLALQIAPPQHRGAAVAITVAAYTLPGLLGAVLLDRLWHGAEPKVLVAADSALRATAFGLIALLYFLGPGLSLTALVAITAVSSLAHAWGLGGRLALIRRLVPGDTLPVNALLASFDSTAMILGPAIAGVLVVVWSAPAVIALDGLSFVVLGIAVASIRLRPHTQIVDAVGTNVHIQPEPAGPLQSTPAATGRRQSGLRVLLGDPLLVRLLVLTFVAVMLSGFLDVGLPLFVKDDLQHSASLFGAMWAGFGLGKLIGGLGAGLLRRFPLYDTAIVIALGWGICLALAIEPRHPATAVVGFTLGGLVFGPYPALMATLLQERLPEDDMAASGAAWSAALTAAAPLGMLVGGAVVAVSSGLLTLRISAYGLIAVALVLGVLRLAEGHRPRAAGRSAGAATEVAPTASTPGAL